MLKVCQRNIDQGNKTMQHTYINIIPLQTNLKWWPCGKQCWLILVKGLILDLEQIVDAAEYVEVL